MKTLRLAVLSTVVAVLTGCPGGGDKCKDVMCPTGQSCDPNTGSCVNGNAGGGSGGSGGNTGGGNNTGGGTGGGNTIDAGPPIPLNMACDELAKAVCAKEERCLRNDPVDRATCIAVQKDACTLVRDVNGMVASFDGAAAAQCFAQLALTDCYDDGAPAICATAFVTGRGQSGTACSATSNCQADAGLYCRAVNGCGTCTAASGQGQACNSAVAGLVATPCRAGLSCSNDRDGGTCQPPQAPGSLCTSTLTTGTTTNGITCASDAGFCPPVPTDGGSRLCQPYAPVGQRCTTTSNCVAGNFCNIVTDGGMSLCEAPRGADQPCTSSIQCQSTLYCPAATVTPRTCRAKLTDGTACTLGAECAAGNCLNDPDYYSFEVLDAGARTCGFLGAGAPCFIDPDCGPGNHCKNFHVPRPDAGYVFGQCAAKDVDGGACVNSETLNADSCANPLATCLDAKCVVTPNYTRGAGESCDISSQCKWPTYCADMDEYTFEGHCSAAFLDAGEPCDFMVPEECGPAAGCFYDGVNDFCLPTAHAGQACSNDNGPGCFTYNECIDSTDGGSSTCVPFSTTGGACSAIDYSAPSCYSSFCPTDAGTCTARQTNGASCTSNGQCSSLRCVNPDAGSVTNGGLCTAACF